MEKTFEIYCRRCQLSLSLADYPQHIIDVHHKQDDKICEMCEEIFQEERELEEHLESHIGKSLRIKTSQAFNDIIKYKECNEETQEKIDNPEVIVEQTNEKEEECDDGTQEQGNCYYFLIKFAFIPFISFRSDANQGQISSRVQ